MDRLNYPLHTMCFDDLGSPGFEKGIPSFRLGSRMNDCTKLLRIYIIKLLTPGKKIIHIIRDNK